MERSRTALPGPALELARPRRFERPTSTSAGWRSIQLSYGRSEEAGTLANPTGKTGGEGGIRTHGTVSSTRALQARAFSHSATSPQLFDASLACGSLRGSRLGGFRRAPQPLRCFARAWAGGEGGIRTLDTV